MEHQDTDQGAQRHTHSHEDDLIRKEKRQRSPTPLREHPRSHPGGPDLPQLSSRWVTSAHRSTAAGLEGTAPPHLPRDACHHPPPPTAKLRGQAVPLPPPPHEPECRPPLPNGFRKEGKEKKTREERSSEEKRQRAVPREAAPPLRPHWPDGADEELLLPQPAPGPRQELLAPQIGPAPRAGVERRLLLGRRRHGGGRAHGTPAPARRRGILPLGAAVGERRGGLPGGGEDDAAPAGAGVAAQEEPERRGVGLAVTELGLHGGRGRRRGRAVGRTAFTRSLYLPLRRASAASASCEWSGRPRPAPIL